MKTPLKILAVCSSILFASGYVVFYASGWDVRKAIFPKRVAVDHYNELKGIDQTMVIYGCSNNDYLPGIAPSVANVQPSGWDISSVIYSQPAAADHSNKLSAFDHHAENYGSNNDYLPYVAPIPLKIKPLAAVQFAPGYEPTSALQQ